MPPKAAQASGSERKSDYGPFSDASCSYWPEGWGWERYSDPDVDFTTLSEDERAKMLNGLQQVLSDDGMRSLFVCMRQRMRELRDKRLNEHGVPPPEYKAPDFLKHQQNTHLQGPWGFVAFRTASYDDDAKWTEFKQRVQRILQVAFDKVVAQYRVARELDGASVETLRGWYTEVRKDKDTPAGMDYGTFLFASPEAVESLLSLEEDNLLNVKTAFWCDDAPSLLVVMDAVEVHTHGDKEDEYDPIDPNDGGNWYKSVFKVPVEIIVDSPRDLFDVAFIPPSGLTR